MADFVGATETMGVERVDGIVEVLILFKAWTRLKEPATMFGVEPKFSEWLFMVITSEFFCSMVAKSLSFFLKGFTPGKQDFGGIML
jgi:hypothetical protein